MSLESVCTNHSVHHYVSNSLISVVTVLTISGTFNVVNYHADTMSPIAINTIVYN